MYDRAVQVKQIDICIQQRTLPCLDGKSHRNNRVKVDKPWNLKNHQNAADAVISWNISTKLEMQFRLTTCTYICAQEQLKTHHKIFVCDNQERRNIDKGTFLSDFIIIISMHVLFKDRTRKIWSIISRISQIFVNFLACQTI